MGTPQGPGRAPKDDGALRACLEALWEVANALRHCFPSDVVDAVMDMEVDGLLSLLSSGNPVDWPAWGASMRSRSWRAATCLRRRMRAFASDPSALAALCSLEQPACREAERREELGAAVEDELARLPPAHQEAVRLHYFAGMTISEIADRLGRPSATVNGWLCRARRKLKPFLAWLLL